MTEPKMNKQEYWDERYLFYRETMDRSLAKSTADCDVAMAICEGKINEE